MSVIKAQTITLKYDVPSAHSTKNAKNTHALLSLKRYRIMNIPPDINRPSDPDVFLPIFFTILLAIGETANVKIHT